MKTMMAPGDGDNGHSGATVNLLDDSSTPISIVLVDDSGSYAFSRDHDFYNDVSGGALTGGTSLGGVSRAIEALDTPVLTNGTTGVKYDAVDFTAAGTGSITNVGDGSKALNAIVIFHNTGDVATAELIAFIDTGTGFDVTPNASTVDIVWHENGIFNFNYT